MNIDLRLRKLEERLKPTEAELTPEEHMAILCEKVSQKQMECAHVINPRIDYPHRTPPVETPRRVVKGHCDHCGFDAPCWDMSNATEDHYLDLLAEEGWPEGGFARELLAGGFIKYVAWSEWEQVDTVEEMEKRGWCFVIGNPESHLTVHKSGLGPRRSEEVSDYVN